MQWNTLFTFFFKQCTYSEHLDELQKTCASNLELEQEKSFPKWFKDHISY